MLALPLLALFLAAPPPDQPRAEALLSSPRPIDKAWGAYLAGRLNLAPLIPKLTAELDHLRPIPSALDRENWSLAHILLDTLIELKAPLSHEQLNPWLGNYRNEALILLLQNARGNQRELLELRPSLNRQDHWLAATNVLVQQRAAGIVAALLSELKPEHTLSVVDSPGGGVGRGEGGGFSGCGAVEFARDFPPAALYQIVTDPNAGDILLAPGPRNVYLRRVIVPTNIQIGWSESGNHFDTQVDLIAYLTVLTGRSEADTRQALAARSIIHWSTPEAFNQDARSVLLQQAFAIRELVLQFIRNQTLTTLELATLNIYIEPKSEDLRKNRSVPLPAISPFPADLTAP